MPASWIRLRRRLLGLVLALVLGVPVLARAQSRARFRSYRAMHSQIKSRRAEVRTLWQAKNKRQVIDAYHGYVDRPHGVRVRARLLRSKLSDRRKHSQQKRKSYDSERHDRQRRQAVAETLFRDYRLTAEQVERQVVTVPGSSQYLLRSALKVVNRGRGDVVLMPEGYYKSVPNHIEADDVGLQIVTFPVERDGRISADALDRALTQNRDRLRTVLFTLPANMGVTEYSSGELRDLSRVLLRHQAPAIVDATFADVVSSRSGLAKVGLEFRGQQVSMSDHVLTIAGNSKGYNARKRTGEKRGSAFGPAPLIAAIKRQARVDARSNPEIRETAETHRQSIAVLRGTSARKIARKRRVLERRNRRARGHVARINRALVGARHSTDPGDAPLKVLTDNAEGPFLTLVFDKQFMRRAGVRDSWQLQDFLLAAAGIDSVAIAESGMRRLAVRLNIDAPGTPASGDRPTTSARNTRRMFDRIQDVLRAVDSGALTYDRALERLSPGTRLKPVSLGAIDGESFRPPGVYED